ASSLALPSAGEIAECQGGGDVLPASRDGFTPSTWGQAFIEQGNCLGTYIHGFFDNPAVRQYLLGGKPQDAPTAEDFRQSQYDKLARHVRQHVDIQLIYKILRENHD
ncbi:MAG: hypothetical protein LUI09_01790, partial [Prevotellaceae bacterium]|nr:hypothetical protein [Prevotellaceae bacterium]